MDRGRAESDGLSRTIMNPSMEDVLHRRAFWVLQTAGWSAFTVGMVLSRLGQLPFLDLVIIKTVLAAGGVLVTLVLREVWKRMPLGSRPIWQHLGWVVIGSVIAALVWTTPYNVWLQLYIGGTGIPERFGQLFFGGFYHAFTLLSWSLLYYGAKAAVDMQRQRERAVQAEAQARQAELKALQYQLNPHFFFNTLNTISTLVLDGRTGPATDMIARLADLMRRVMEPSPGLRATLAEEWDMIREYLSIERIRFGHRLEVDMEVEPAFDAVPIPRLLLQPLVENAIIHGIAHREEGGHLEITAKPGPDGTVDIRISNPVSPTAVRTSTEGIGLANVQSRLDAFYDGAAHLTYGPRPPDRYEVHVRLPA